MTEITKIKEKVSHMRKVRIVSVVVCLLVSAFAQQAPYGRKDVAVSAKDRVYSADQTSNTVSVVDPSTNKLLGVIKLGDPVPGSLSPLYKGALLVHGLGYSPDSKTLAVVSTGSNSVTLIDTATNKVKGTVYIGRAPHEAMFTPDGREIWVTVRGESYVSVIDPAQMKEVRQIDLANGPGMTMFSPDGRYGFVCSSFTTELSVIDTKSHQVVDRLKQASPFCPDIAVSPEGDEVWITLKDIGKTQVFDARPPFAEKALLETGPITNHVNFANNANGKFAYVTIGGTNEVKVFRREAKPEMVATIPVGDLPHGLWPSGDGSRIYVALENGGTMAAIDTMTNKVIANPPIGQSAQALVYVPNAAPSGAGTEDLSPVGQAANTAHLKLQAAGPAFPNAHATAAVNSLGLLDLVEIAAAGLAPKAQYQVYLADSDKAPFGKMEALAVLKTNPDGAGITQAIGPMKSVAASAAAAGAERSRRYLVVTAMGEPSQVVMVQEK